MRDIQMLTGIDTERPMKDALLFLLAYPLWVKTVVVTLLSACVLLLLVFKPDLPKDVAAPTTPNVTVNVGINQGGNVAGRDVVVNAGPTGAQPEELVRVLQARADRIHRELAPNFKYVDVKRFIEDFERLHQAHIAALRRNNLVEAHEYLTQIHEVSRKLERSEFWARHEAEAPDIRYSLSLEAFQRGKLIQWYAGQSAMEALVTEAVGSRWIEKTTPPQTADPKNVYDQVTK